MPTILICEDEELIRWSLEQHLRSLGHEVDDREDGISCIERLTEPMPDLIILDLVMPSGGGLAVLKHLQSLPVRPPTLLLTAHSPNHKDVQAAMEGGADAYLAKPFSLEAITEQVERLLAGEPGATTAAPARCHSS